MVQVTKNTTQAWERMLFPFIPLHSPSFQIIFPSFPVRSPSFQNPNRRLKTSSFGAQKRDWASKGSKSHLVIEQSSRGRRGKFGPNFIRNFGRPKSMVLLVFHLFLVGFIWSGRGEDWNEEGMNCNIGFIYFSMVLFFIPIHSRFIPIHSPFIPLHSSSFQFIFPSFPFVPLRSKTNTSDQQQAVLEPRKGTGPPRNQNLIWS